MKEPITAAPAGGGGGAWQLRSAAQPQSCRERLPVPPPASSRYLSHLRSCLSPPPTVLLDFRPLPEAIRGASRLVSFSIEDAGLYGDDHYVPAVGQTEASPGSAAAAEAAPHRRTRAYYLPRCECK